jgi:hypothetical protein
VAGVSPRLVLRDTRGWSESQDGDIRFYTLRSLSPTQVGIRVAGVITRLVVRGTRGWGESRLVVRDPRAWGGSQARGIGCYSLRYLSPRLVVRDTPRYL